jgi:glycosyltransferase involved in cell wall biosynthesis
MSRLRVGILANANPSITGFYTGGNVNFVEVAKRMCDTDVTVFAPAEAETELRKVLPDAEFVPMPDVRGKHWRLQQIMRAVMWIGVRRKLKSVDVLWATSHFLANVLPAVASKPGRVVVTIHHFAGSALLKKRDFVGAVLPSISQAFALFISRPFVSAYVFVSPYWRKRFRWFIGRKRSYIGPNGVANRESPVYALRKRDIVFLGRLDRTKRIEEAIAAWSRLPAEIRSGVLHIIGDGDRNYLEELRRLAASLNVESSVIFHGRVDEGTKWSILEQSSLFLFPSAEEGWGIAIAEAMASGLPCVTADLPVYAGLFDRGRISVHVGDIDGYARACERLLVNEEERRALACDATALAKTLSWERSAAVVHEALLQAAKDDRQTT